MKEEQDDESSDRDTMGGPITEQPAGASEGAATEQQAQQARRSVAEGSASDDSRQIAIAGYMADRNHLVKKSGELNYYYESHQKTGAHIAEEIARIDAAVLALLSLPNTSSQRTRHPAPAHQPTEATTQEQRPGSL